MADSEYVTYRELLSLLDQRDSRYNLLIRDVTQRVETLDAQGSRGLLRVTDRLDSVIRDLEEHAADHREMAKRNITNKQWAVTTFFTLCATVFAAIAMFHGG